MILSSNTSNSPLSFTGKRVVRSNSPERHGRLRAESRQRMPGSCLVPDSLGYELLLGAFVIAQVRAGKSLGEALSLLVKEPIAARAAAQDIAYGVLRRHGWGEFILGRLMTRPLTHAETQALMLAALYRLETRPESAPMIVDQAVTAAGELAKGAFKAVVNGVLRNFLRQRDVLLAAAEQDDVARYWHPAWWLARLRRNHRDDWQRIVATGNRPPPMALRVNLRRGSVDNYLSRLESAGIRARPIGNAGVILEKPVGVEALPGFFEGAVSVQDFGAQRATELLNPKSGWRVLDACAAPGGKTAHLLEQADLDLLALDVDPVRTLRIVDNLQRLGLSAITCTADALAVDEWWDGRSFDAILADVPCSASGVVRRHPDIKTLRRESDIRSLTRAQAAMLDTLWPLLRPGGWLLYATCSVFVEENSAQIDAFLVRRPNVTRIAEEQWFPQDDNDGFYYALLQKG